MISRFQVFLLGLVFLCGPLCAQYPASHHYSTEAEAGRSPCQDTLHLLWLKRGYDIGLILPEWQMVVGPEYVAVVEGMVKYDHNTGLDGPEVSHEDFPFFHYTHDMCVDIVPDSTPDGRYTNLLPYLISKHADGSADTTMQQALGLEWESGLGAGNKLNPCTRLNNTGKSCGGCSAGHEAGDRIWQWPTAGDWIHAEGLYIWDRGHPPARCEIHPARFMAIRRNIPAKIKAPDGTDKYATRIDIFASGDGGAINNVKPSDKPYVRHTRMSSKDYQFSCQVNLSRPSPSARLNVWWEKHKGDTYEAKETASVSEDGTVTVTVPWQSLNIADSAVYARTLYAYWNEGSGTSDSIDEYKVDLKKLYLKKLSELGDKAELRLFVNVGSDWIFLNDFFGKGGKILTRGLGETFRKNWTLSNEFTLYMPRTKCFRVYMAGWEADGVDYLMGDLMNPYVACGPEPKAFFRKRFFSIKNMLLRGCEDDEMREMSRMHSYFRVPGKSIFTIYPIDGMSTDPCPFSQYPLKNRYFLTYTVTQEK